MYKGLTVFAVLAGLIIGLWIIGRITGALQYYNIPTPSNEPNIKVQTKILVSNLKKPERGDFIVYTSAAKDSAVMANTSSEYIHRLCAIEGDTIYMKDGVLYVNGENADKLINLYHFYTVSISHLDALITDEDYASGNVVTQNDSITIVNLTKVKVASLPIDVKISRYLHPVDTTYGPFKWHQDGSSWSTDNFGPIIIPAGHGFVLGDNRHNSLDSRYAGFLALKDIKGVKL